MQSTANDINDLLQQALAALTTGDLKAAAAATQAVLNIDPAQPDGLMIFAHLLRKVGNFTGAEEKIKQAISLRPQKIPYYILYADILMDLQKEKDAIGALEAALLFDSESVELLCKLAALYLRAHLFDKAAEVAGKAFALKPADKEAWMLAQSALYRYGNTEAAAAILEKARRYNSSLRFHFIKATLFPSLLQTAEEGKKWIESSIMALNALKNLSGQPDEIVDIPFYQSYYGLDVRPYMETLSNTLRRCVPALSFSAPHATNTEERPLKKIAFISEYFHGHVISKYLSPIIRAIAQESKELEIVVFSASGKEDAYSSSLKQGPVSFIKIPRTLSEAQNLISSHQPDIIVYMDIGMSAFTYLLAHARLAPVQCVAAGHPITTGISTLDYFFSARLAEPENGDEHYIEKPVKFESLPIMFSPKPSIPSSYKSREELGLPEGRRLYTCPVYLHRIHPDMDDVFKKILTEDGDAEIFLFDMYYPTLWAKQIKERFVKTLGDVLAKRIRILPYAQGDDFIHYAKAADAVIDCMHFSMGTTLCRLFAAGIPVVTLPGGFMRSRTCHMLYKLMEIPEAPIATDAENLANLSFRLAKDKEWQESLEANLTKAHPVLYENRKIVDEWKEFFRTVWDNK